MGIEADYRKEHMGDFEAKPVRTIVTQAYKDIRARAQGNHTGFCMSTYVTSKCYDCPTEAECLGMFLQDERENG